MNGRISGGAVQHTPGPWRLTATSHGLRLAGEAPGKPGYFATLDDSRPETRANARLIAAAPELLAACQELHRILHGGMTEDYDEMTAALCRAREAIQKAAA